MSEPYYVTLVARITVPVQAESKDEAERRALVHARQANPHIPWGIEHTEIPWGL